MPFVMEDVHLQFEQCQVRIAIVRLALALPCDILLEYRRCFGVVSIEAVEYCVDVFRPLRR